MSTLKKDLQVKFGFWVYKNRNLLMLSMLPLMVLSMIYFFVMNLTAIGNMTQNWSYVHAIPFIVVIIIYIVVPIIGLKNWNENYLIVIYEAKEFSKKLNRDEQESFFVSNKLYDLIEDTISTKNPEKLTRWIEVYKMYKRYMNDLKEKSELLKTLPLQISEIEKNVVILWDYLKK